MKKLYSFMGLSALILLVSSCKKDLQTDNSPNSLLAYSARHGEKDLDLIFYALGEGNKLDKFSMDSKVDMLASATITGLVNSEKILAIDFRPATGQLYGLGSSSRIYVIDPKSGLARVIGSGPFTPLLAGTIAGFDFNPTVDRIRVVTSTGQNLRINPETGAVAVVDGNINGVTNAMVTSVAYSNNVAGAATTILYDIDVKTDKLYKQNPPNDGKLEEIGSLNVNLEGEGGFDIAPPTASDNANSSKNSGSFDNTALAIYHVNRKSTLFTIDLNTGKAKKIEKFDRSTMYYGIAIATLPVAYAISATDLVIFNPNRTSNTTIKPITGLQSGEKLVGIDFRPVNGQLYGLGSDSRLYTINASSGAASFVATLSTPLMGTSFGFDFNPMVDRIRIVSNSGQNLRVNPNDGMATVDGSLNPGTPSVSAAAYANNFAGTTTTTLYVIDAENDKLYIQNPPNAGTLSMVGNLGINVDASNGLDIGGTSNLAYGLFTVSGKTRIYSIDINSGRAKAGGNLPGKIAGFTLGLNL